VELSDEAVRQLYVDYKWSLAKIGHLVGRPPTWTAAVLERQGVARRPAQQSGRRAPKPKRPRPEPVRPVARAAQTRLTKRDFAYAANRTICLSMPNQPYVGDSSIGLCLMITHAAPFQLSVQAALRLVYGLEDGVRWPVSKAHLAADAAEWDVRRAKQKIDGRLLAWQVARDSTPAEA
jgi:hypothetical protein